MKYLPLLLLLCSCTPSNPLPNGYELVQMNTGWYLRTNGVFLQQPSYVTRDEALNAAYVMAGMRSAPPNSTIGVSDPTHVKVDGVLTQTLATNRVTVSNSVHILGVRQVWIEFKVYDTPFKGLLREDVISDQPDTNTFKLSPPP